MPRGEGGFEPSARRSPAADPGTLAQVQAPGEGAGERAQALRCAADVPAGRPATALLWSCAEGFPQY